MVDTHGNFKLCYYYFVMVFGCKQKMAEGFMTFVRNLTLMCHCKQRRHFDFSAIWRTRAAILNCYGFGM